MTTFRLLRVPFALAILTGCSSGDGRSAAPPSMLPSTMIPTGPAEQTGSLPTSSPAGGTGNLTSGRLTFQLSGDVEVEKTLATLVNSVYAPPPGGLAIVWTAGGADASTVGLGGSTFTGTRETSPSLSVSVTAQTSRGIARFVSTEGECAITIVVASADEIAGAFECDELVGSSGEVVDASASFVATG
jgi:hypothetical protein